MDEQVFPGGGLASPLNMAFAFFVDLYKLYFGRFFFMQNKSLLNAKGLTLTALLVAMAILLKSFLSFETGSFRFTFYEIPMVFIGALFGPVVGGISGFIVDFFHVLFSPWAFSFNVFTISNMLWGIIPGLLIFSRNWKKRTLLVTLILSFLLTFALNTIGIVQFQGTGAMLATLPYRVLIMLIKVPLDMYFILLLHERVFVQHSVLINEN